MIFILGKCNTNSPSCCPSFAGDMNKLTTICKNAKMQKHNDLYEYENRVSSWIISFIVQFNSKLLVINQQRFVQLNEKLKLYKRMQIEQ